MHITVISSTNFRKDCSINQKSAVDLSQKPDRYFKQNVVVSTFEETHRLIENQNFSVQSLFA